MKPRIEIHKNPTAEQPFHVVYLSQKHIGDGKFEMLAHCENLPNREDCIKNIISMAHIFVGEIPSTGLRVTDYSQDGLIINVLT